MELNAVHRPVAMLHAHQDPAVLAEKGEEIRSLLSGVPGVSNPRVLTGADEPTIEVVADPERARAFGIKPGDVRRTSATLLSGLTVGNLLMLHPLLLAARFGVRDYGRIYSRSQLVATLGVAAGPLFIGALHDVVDGYGIAFAVAGGASLLAAGVLAVSGPTHVPVPATSS